jgi:hypothetical protein
LRGRKGQWRCHIVRRRRASAAERWKIHLPARDLRHFCGLLQGVFVLPPQHLDSFDSENTDSPKKAAIAAVISFSGLRLYC